MFSERAKQVNDKHIKMPSMSLGLGNYYNIKPKLDVISAH